jgi:hypothetical protein
MLNLRRVRLATLVTAVACSLAAGLAGQRVTQTVVGPPVTQETTVAVEGTAAISGVVYDGTSGQPLIGAIVTLTGPTARAGGAGTSARMATDDKGRFIFMRLPPSDSYLLSAAMFGYVDGRTRARIALAEGQWIADAKVTLSKLGAISGVVTDEAGEPVVGTFVRVLSNVMVSGGAIWTCNCDRCPSCASLARSRHLPTPESEASRPVSCPWAPKDFHMAARSPLHLWPRTARLRS